jgi:hypothetical protein
MTSNNLKMKFKTILKFSLSHLSILTFILFLRFINVENGDMNVAVFGTFIYLPYIFCFTIFNSTLLTLGFNWFKTSLIKWVAPVLTFFALIIWFIVLDGQLEIHYWKLTWTELIIFNLMILLINIGTVCIITKQQKENIESE